MKRRTVGKDVAHARRGRVFLQLGCFSVLLAFLACARDQSGLGESSESLRTVSQALEVGPLQQLQPHPSQRYLGAQFGFSSTIFGDIAVLGAPFDIGNASDPVGSGSVFVFERQSGTTWLQQERLRPTSAFDGASFGYSVALEGARLLVGTPGEASVSVFDQDGAGSFGPTADHTITGPSGAIFGPPFGTSVALSGDRLIVGAPDDFGEGTASIFELMGSFWTPMSPALGVGLGVPGFGTSVAIDGELAVVGAPEFFASGGSAYIFRREASGWVQEFALVASDAVAGDAFGSSVSLADNLLVVGAPQTGPGAAYVFERISPGVWTERQKLVESDGAPVVGDAFGMSVALKDGRLAIGAPFVDTNGAAFLFEQDPPGVWVQVSKQLGMSSGDALGWSVALSNSDSLLGVPGVDNGGDADAGAAQVFQLFDDNQQGNPCADGPECLSGFCVDGVCCENECGGEDNSCSACSVAGGSSEDGICTVLADTTSCDDGSACTADDVCIAGYCTGSTLSCDDGNECTVDSCDDVVGCVVADAAPGAACGDALDTECTNPDSCDGSGACQVNNEASGFLCGDASDTECTNPDSCDGSGACQVNHEAPGAACGDASDTECTNPDSCDGSGACLDNHAPTGTLCDDMDSCTFPDQCLAGSCIAGPPLDTDGDGALDCEEECDTDPLKTDPGLCGCGEPDSPSTFHPPEDRASSLCLEEGNVDVGVATALACNDSLALAVTGQVVATNGVPLVAPLPVDAGSVVVGPGTHTIEWRVADPGVPAVTQMVELGVGIQASQGFIVEDRAELRNTFGGYATVFNSGGAVTEVRSMAHVGGVLSGSSVVFGAGAYSERDVTSAGTVDALPSAVGGSIMAFASVNLPALPALPAFPSLGYGYVWVNSGSTLTLSPGAHPHVTVNSSASLNFTSGDYFFRSLTINSNSTVNVQSDTRIFVKDSLALRSSLRNGSQLQALVLGFQGENLVVEADFDGHLLAPNAEVKFGTAEARNFRGAFHAESIDVRPDIKLICDPNLVSGSSSSSPVPVTASLLVTTDWGAGYCADIRVTNLESTSTTDWALTLNTNGTTPFSYWNAIHSEAFGSLTVEPEPPWAKVVEPGVTEQGVGFCATRPSGGSKIATVIAAGASY